MNSSKQSSSSQMNPENYSPSSCQKAQKILNQLTRARTWISQIILTTYQYCSHHVKRNMTSTKLYSSHGHSLLMKTTSRTLTQLADEVVSVSTISCKPAGLHILKTRRQVQVSGVSTVMSLRRLRCGPVVWHHNCTCQVCRHVLH